MLNIGDRIIELRENQDISQIGLSKKVGISATTLSKYDKNLREPRADVIVKLADALHTTADFLLWRTADRSPLDKDSAWSRVNNEENTLLQTFRCLPEREKGQILERMQMLYEQNFKKQTDSISCNNDFNNDLSVKQNDEKRNIRF